MFSLEITRRTSISKCRSSFRRGMNRWRRKRKNYESQIFFNGEKERERFSSSAEDPINNDFAERTMGEHRFPSALSNHCCESTHINRPASSFRFLKESSGDLLHLQLHFFLLFVRVTFLGRSNVNDLFDKCSTARENPSPPSQFGILCSLRQDSICHLCRALLFFFWANPANVTPVRTRRPWRERTTNREEQAMKERDEEEEEEELVSFHF